MADVDTAHEIKEQLHAAVFYPGHPPRRTTEAYAQTHHLLCIEQNTPCYICGLRHSDIDTPGVQTLTNPRGAHFMETHHFWVQDSLADACDWRKVQKQFPQVDSLAAFTAFVDSPQNCVALCDNCHLGFGGIHRTSWNYFIIQRYVLDGYRLFDEDGIPADVASYLTIDEHVQQAYAAVAAAEEGIIRVESSSG